MFSIYGSALMVGFKEELFKINATFVKNPSINATYLISDSDERLASEHDFTKENDLKF